MLSTMAGTTKSSRTPLTGIPKPKALRTLEHAQEIMFVIKCEHSLLPTGATCFTTGEWVDFSWELMREASGQ
jgi:hypothetical protein